MTSVNLTLYLQERSPSEYSWIFTTFWILYGIRWSIVEASNCENGRVVRVSSSNEQLGILFSKIEKLKNMTYLWSPKAPLLGVGGEREKRVSSNILVSNFMRNNFLFEEYFDTMSIFCSILPWIPSTHSFSKIENCKNDQPLEPLATYLEEIETCNTVQ